MENERNEYFDLPTLLKLGDFNVRGIASAKTSLSVGEYFKMLTKFVDLAPAVSSALNRFADRDGNKDACRSLDDMTVILADLKCDKYITEFYNILDAFGKGDWRLAATHAKRIADDFDGFHSRVLKAKRTRRPETLPDSKTADSPPDEISLKAFIDLLDAEEADRKMMILAVDDSPVLLQSLTSVLSGDYKVFTLTKPAMLEKILRQITPELFLLDYQMPDLTGFDLIPIIRSFEEHKDTPIIFLTSAGTIDNVSSALMLGASDFVVKPVRPEILREKIARHIQRKKTF
jgi:CheY-like chemotaxis protein